MNIKSTLAVVAFAATFGQANAVLVTDGSGYGGLTLDLSGQVGTGYNFTFGPVSLPNGITFTAAPGGGGNSGQGSVLGQGSYGLASNGAFGGDAVYAGVDSGTGYMDFTFSSAITEFGVYANYAPGYGDAPTITALDEFGAVVESYDLSADAPISTPGGFNEFAFRGIKSDTEFTTFRMGGSYIIAAGSPDGSVVPEPASMTALALGALALIRKRKQA
jgi:hypothetical protein